MNLSILFPFIIIASLALVAFLIYRSPLDLQIAMERTGASTALMLSAKLVCTHSSKARLAGERDRSPCFFLGKALSGENLPENQKSGKARKEYPELRTGQDLLLQTLPLGPDMIRILKASFVI